MIIPKEEFAAKSLYEKWAYIRRAMDHIQGTDTAFNMRRRINPHHPKEHVEEETRQHRRAQYYSWLEIKNFYAEYRDEMSDTLGQEQFRECHSIMERIFTKELDDAIRDVIDDP